MSRRFQSSRVFTIIALSTAALACADTGDEQAGGALEGGETTSETGQTSSANSNGTSTGDTGSSLPGVNPTSTSSSGQTPSAETPSVDTSTANTSSTRDGTSSGDETSSAAETTGSETTGATGGEMGSETDESSTTETGDGETQATTDDTDSGGASDTTSDAGTSDSDVTSDDESSTEAPACPAAPALTGGQQYCSNQRGNAGNGYGYELWAEGSGSGCMTVYGAGAAFSASWTDVEDFLARVGLDFDETRTHQQIGNIWAEFSETQTGSEEGLTYVGMYGWTVDPLREFYILDDWGATKPAGVASDGSPRDEVGVLEIDGETYDVWKKTREEKPSIKGTATFDQYFSIRRTPRSCGRISVSEHFAGWERLGLPFGKLYEVKLLVESQFNSGSVEFTSAEVGVD